MTVLVACGLAREARILAGPGVVAVAGGGDAGRLEAGLEAYAGKARVLLSSGLCGALDPALRVGDLVVGRLAQTGDLDERDPSFTSPRRGEVARRSLAGEGDQGSAENATPPHPALRADLSKRRRMLPTSSSEVAQFGNARIELGRGEDPRFSLNADEGLLALLRALLPDAHVGPFAGVDRIVATAEAKRALREATGAIAADMESHVAARVARRHGVPFAIVRAVSDAADQSLPPAALVGMRPDGGVALGAVLRSVAQNPAQIPALIATGIRAERAFRALLRGRRRLRAGDLDPHLGDMV